MYGCPGLTVAEVRFLNFRLNTLCWLLFILLTVLCTLVRPVTEVHLFGLVFNIFYWLLVILLAVLCTLMRPVIEVHLLGLVFNILYWLLVILLAVFFTVYFLCIMFQAPIRRFQLDQNRNYLYFQASPPSHSLVTLITVGLPSKL